MRCTKQGDLAVRYGRGSPAHKSGVFILGEPQNKKTTRQRNKTGGVRVIDRTFQTFSRRFQSSAFSVAIEGNRKISELATLIMLNLM